MQMQGQYRDEACKIPEGRFNYYHGNGHLASTGSYHAGKRQGLWLDFHSNGQLSDSAVYEQGQIIGTQLTYHSNGFMSDSANHKPDGSGVSVSWFDNGNPSQAGYFTVGVKKQGKWQYFHRNGQLSAVESYDNGVLRSKQYYDENGQELSDTTSTDQQAQFPGGEKAWAAYLAKQLYFPDQWKIVNGDNAVVTVDWVVDEQGVVSDVKVYASFHPEFDRIAVKAVSKSPKWIPARLHNRFVKAYRRQSVTFQQ